MTIIIQDINEFPPILTRNTYIGKILKLQPFNTIVYFKDVINTTDRDYTKANKTYSITGTGKEKFKIDGDTGIIRSNDLFMNQEMFNFSLNVMDVDGLKSSSKVIIYVLDNNMHAPNFSANVRHVSISEGELVGNVYTANAVDKDDGLNGMITYSMQGGGKEFAIDESGGN